jgi:alpha-ribazole phosphatase
MASQKVVYSPHAMTTEIFYIRHTRVNVPDGFCYGQTDVDIAEPFDPPFEEIIARLPRDPDARIISSPLKRAGKLATAFAKEIGRSESGKPIEVEYDRRLMEVDLGEFEGGDWGKLKSDERFRRWDEDMESKAPGGESFKDLYDRANDFFIEKVREFENMEGKSTPDSRGKRRIFVVTHGGIIRSTIAGILGGSVENSFRVRTEYGGIVKITLERRENEKETRISFDQMVNFWTKSGSS